MLRESVSLRQIEEISVGETAWFAKTVTEADVMMFAQLSGDYAPHHVNKEFGDTTMFHSRIAHGMLTAGLICPVLTKLCGGASYIYSQEVRFKTAVLLNDTIVVRGEVTAVDVEQKQVSIDIVCTKQNSQPGDRPVILGKFVQSMDVDILEDPEALGEFTKEK